MSQDDMLLEYLARIGFDGLAAPNIDTLRQLHQLHPAAIAFENIDVLAKKPIVLDPSHLHDKLVRLSRGGYCFEHNIYFQSVLEKIGFSVNSLSARILWHAPPDNPFPRNHMVLAVEADGEMHLADVGYGRLTMTGPLLFKPGIEQNVDGTIYRLLERGPEFLLQLNLDGVWTDLYQISQEGQISADWKMANHFCANHPDSPFVANLMAARSLPDRRLGLFNNVYRIHHRDGQLEQRNLAEAANLETVLRDDFGIVVPDDCKNILDQVIK